MSQPACQLPSSSPGLWGQFSPIPLSSFHTPGNSQEQQQQPQQRDEDNEQQAGAVAGAAQELGSHAEVAATAADQSISSSPSPTPTPTLNPFDVGLPWTQGQHMPTQMQRRFFLDRFNLPKISTRIDEEGDEVVVVAESSAMGAMREKRKRAVETTGAATPQASSSRPRPRPRTLMQNKEQEQGEGDGAQDDEEPSATQFFSRRRPGTARDPSQDDDDEAGPSHRRSPSQQPGSPRRGSHSAGDAGGQQAERAPSAEPQDISDAQSQHHDEAGATSASISISTSTLPSSNRSSSLPTPPPPTGMEPETRRGLAPLLNELSAEKQAGYWAQLSTGAGDGSLLCGGGSAWDVDDSRQGLGPRTPAAMRGRGAGGWAERVHSDSRLLPNRFVAQEDSDREDEDEEQELMEDPDYVDGQEQGMFAAAALRARTAAAAQGQRAAPADETPIRPRAGAAQTTTAAAAAAPAIRSALDITADFLEAGPVAGPQAAPAAGPSYRPSDLMTPARSRNQHGMGLARKTWDTTWLADGGRVVRGRIVKNNTGEGPFGGRGASSTGGGARGRKKTTGRGAAGNDGSPTTGAAAARRGAWRGGRGGGPQRGRGRGRGRGA